MCPTSVIRPFEQYRQTCVDVSETLLKVKSNKLDRISQLYSLAGSDFGRITYCKQASIRAARGPVRVFALTDHNGKSAQILFSRFPAIHSFVPFATVQFSRKKEQSAITSLVNIYIVLVHLQIAGIEGHIQILASQLLRF